MGDIVVGKIEQPTTRHVAGASGLKTLLADIISFRDECLVAKRDLIPAADPTGDARLAYGVVSDQLTALIKRHSG